jgi:hypothetical protein
MTPWQRALRVGRISRGYVACVIVAAVVAAPLSFGWDGEALAITLFGAIYLSFLPFVACVLIAEGLSIRSPLYYATWSLVPVALPELRRIVLVPDWGYIWALAPLAAGAIAGSVVYWLIAGRFAGRDRAPTKVSPSEP